MMVGIGRSVRRRNTHATTAKAQTPVREDPTGRRANRFFRLLMPLAAQKAPNAGYSKHEKAAYLDQNLVNFVRPGVKVKIASAAIAKDGTITARVNITDPKGLPLDRDGITTPGTVSMSLIAAYIPAGQKQYLSYTTNTAKASQPGNTNPSQIQAANDSGGIWTDSKDELRWPSDTRLFCPSSPPSVSWRFERVGEN